MSTTSPPHHILYLNSPFPPLPLTFPHTTSTLPASTPTLLEAHLLQHPETTIICTPSARLTPALLSATLTPSLQCIIAMGTGYDHISLSACAARGITVCNVPGQNLDSVTEHAFALLSALRRRIVRNHFLTAHGTWGRNGGLELSAWSGAPPRGLSAEVLGLVGYGALGRRVERMARALGMEVLVAERKGASEVREGRTAFEDVLRTCSALVLTAPLDEGTRGMVAATELGWMRGDAVVVNVGRGGIVDEKALVQALKGGRIEGAATDVFEHEPPTKENCPLLEDGVPNLLLSPHIAWYSQTTVEGAKRMLGQNLECFAAGKPCNIVLPGRMRS